MGLVCLLVLALLPFIKSGDLVMPPSSDRNDQDDCGTPDRAEIHVTEPRPDSKRRLLLARALTDVQTV